MFLIGDSLAYLKISYLCYIICDVMATKFNDLKVDDIVLGPLQESVHTP